MIFVEITIHMDQIILSKDLHWDLIEIYDKKFPTEKSSWEQCQRFVFKCKL